MMLNGMKRALKAIGYILLGGLIAVTAGYVYLLENRPDLKIWHTADLDEEFIAETDVTNFDAYLELESRLFAQLDEQVFDEIEAEDRYAINRFNRNSLSDPAIWPRNWNRTFVLESENPGFGVLLLHGMSDSPYSLHEIGATLNAQGGWVVGLRLPGHGTAPSGMAQLRWQDMAAATQIAMRYLRDQVNNGPLFIIGFSNGGALAVLYALETIGDPNLPEADGLVLISPAIGVTRIAALAVWQARLGHLLGLPKLEWSGIGLEYDPFKYVSFAVNGGDVVYRLTNQIQSRITALDSGDRLSSMPPILAFQSVVDATVSTPALIEGLFNRLPDAGHELVLFDTDRNEEVIPLLTEDYAAGLAALVNLDELPFTVSLITNASADSRQMIVVRRPPFSTTVTEEPFGFEWPEDIFSLSHVALPISPSDPLYGRSKPDNGSRIYLGDVTLRGEKGVFRVPPAELARLRWNPFYAYLEQRVLERITESDPK